MFMKDWKKEVFTIPNILSMIRICMIPIYIRFYLKARNPKDYFLAAGILAISCLTDMVDGQIARKFQMVTTVGKILDPLADKLTQLVLSLTLSLHYPVLRSVVYLLILKELLQSTAALVLFRRGKVLDGSLWSGKIATTVLFVSDIALVLYPNFNPPVVNMIAVVDLSFLIFAFFNYGLAFCYQAVEIQNPDIGT